MKYIPSITNLSELEKILSTSGIDTSHFGRGGAKSLESLLKEIVLGETTLFQTASGKLLRIVEIATADIFYRDKDGITWKLKEEKQVFKDGRIRIRVRERSISEKILPKESTIEAIKRGIYEELGISSPSLNIQEEGSETHSFISWSYPGLQSIYLNYYFLIELDEEHFRPEGYIEKQEEKTNYFIWEQLI